jgi:hypothetical protein
VPELGLGLLNLVYQPFSQTYAAGEAVNRRQSDSGSTVIKSVSKTFVDGVYDSSGGKKSGCTAGGFRDYIVQRLLETNACWASATTRLADHEIVNRERDDVQFFQHSTLEFNFCVVETQNPHFSCVVEVFQRLHTPRSSENI